MRYRIAAIIPHGPLVKEFRLAPQDGAPLPPWRPGAHVELSFRARDGVPHTNAYSIVGEADNTLRIAVQREERGRGGSRALHDEFAVGMELRLGLPMDSFRLHVGARRTVLIGGGIGITPMLSMARTLQALRAPWELHYLVRDATRLVLADDLCALDGSHAHIYLTEADGRPDIGRIIGPWRGGGELHACGPQVLMDVVRNCAATLGWPAQHIHFESFGARLQAQDMPLRVHLRQTGMTLDVAPGTSILDAMIDAEVLVSYECKRGECGNCYAGVLSGEPVHRDICLSPQQRAQGMTPCVSWCRGTELELDL